MAARFLREQESESSSSARGAEQNARLATEIKLRAERRAGEILRETPKQHGSLLQGNVLLPRTDMRSARQLKELGVSQQESSRWQRIAKYSEEKFEIYIEHAQRLTQSAILHAEQRLSTTPARPLPMPNGKFNVIYADPPWPYDVQLRGWRRVLVDYNGRTFLTLSMVSQENRDPNGIPGIGCRGPGRGNCAFGDEQYPAQA